MLYNRLLLQLKTIHNFVLLDLCDSVQFTRFSLKFCIEPNQKLSGSSNVQLLLYDEHNS